MARRGYTSGRENHSANGGQSQRQLRVGELVRQSLSEILTRDRLDVPGLETTAITVCEVRMTPDLKRATCYVTPLGGGDANQLVKALAQKAPALSREIGVQVRLKFTPKLMFKADETFDEVDRISAALNEPRVAADLHSTDQADLD